MSVQNHPQETMVTEPRVLQDLCSLTTWDGCTFQDLDFRQLNIDWQALTLHNVSFLGCTFTDEQKGILLDKGALIIPRLPELPYNPFRKSLYTWQELMQLRPDETISYDEVIYNHFSHYKYNPPILEALAQRIHDHSIDDALRKLIIYDKQGMTQQKCVGIMGGHGTLRTDPFYVKTAQVAKLLAEAGYLVVSGGGPGIMEAANLGAYLAGKPDSVLKEAIITLSKAPHYTDEAYLFRAQEVLANFPEGAHSVAIPTWFYGHEPSNLFASHIAKYFSNSIREDNLLAISLFGVIYAPGSAGTTQEIFMDATQNHYGTFKYISPMVFLGKERYEIQTLIYPLLKQLAWGKQYYDQLFLSDNPHEIVQFIQAHLPLLYQKS